MDGFEFDDPIAVKVCLNAPSLPSSTAFLGLARRLPPLASPIILRAIAMRKRRTTPHGASPSRPVIPIRRSQEQSLVTRRNVRRGLRGHHLPKARKEGARTKHCRDGDNSIFVE
jgi:hypothetical protein